jgi:hypothetical protein
MQINVFLEVDSVKVALSRPAWLSSRTKSVPRHTGTPQKLAGHIPLGENPSGTMTRAVGRWQKIQNENNFSDITEQA